MKKRINTKNIWQVIKENEISLIKETFNSEAVEMLLNHLLLMKSKSPNNKIFIKFNDYFKDISTLILSFELPSLNNFNIAVDFKNETYEIFSANEGIIVKKGLLSLTILRKLLLTLYNDKVITVDDYINASKNGYGLEYFVNIDGKFKNITIEKELKEWYDERLSMDYYWIMAEVFDTL
jgi:hypothetical protein